MAKRRVLVKFAPFLLNNLSTVLAGLHLSLFRSPSCTSLSLIPSFIQLFYWPLLSLFYSPFSSTCVYNYKGKKRVAVLVPLVATLGDPLKASAASINITFSPSPCSSPLSALTTMSATLNYNYSLTFRVQPTAPGNLPTKRVFRSNSPESTRISSSAATPYKTNNAQGNEPSVSASIPLTPPPKSTTHHQHHPWQWRLTLTEEPQHRTQGERGECEGREGEVEKAAEVDLSVELRGLSTTSSLPSSGPFGGFLLQYKSFGIVAKNTRFTLVSKTIDSSSALSLQGNRHTLTTIIYYSVDDMRYSSI